jgi:predicted RNase H-like nuclease (RuvC/YqgF family)
MAIKLTAEASAFKKEMQEAAKTVKQLQTESKLADSELRKTGDTQAYVEQKTAALNKQISEQQKAVAKLEAALRMKQAMKG